MVDHDVFPPAFAETKFAAVTTIEDVAPQGPTISAVAISNDGRLIAYGNTDGYVQIDSAREKAKVGWFEIKGGIIDVVVFCDEMSLMASSHFQEKSSNYTFHGSDRRLTLPYCDFCAVTPDDAFIAYSVRFSVNQFDIKNRKQFFHIGKRPDVSALAQSDDGKRVTYGTVEGGVSIWEPGGERVFHVKDAHSGPVKLVAISPDGKELASAGKDGQLRIWNVADKKSLHQKKDFGEVADMIVSANGKELILLHDGALERWDLNSGELKKTLETPFAAALAGFSNNRGYVVVAKKNARNSDDVHVIALEE